VHAAAARERVAEVAGGAGDTVLGQVLLQARSLPVRVVLLLPPATRLSSYGDVCQFTETSV